jgi:hypothetical protein
MCAARHYLELLGGDALRCLLAGSLTKSIFTVVPKFVADRIAAWAVLGAPAGLPLKLGPGSHTVGLKKIVF